MYAVHVKTEPKVWDVRHGQPSRIRKVDIDDQHGQNREQNVETQITKPDVCVVGKDLAVPVTVPEENMLLQDRLETLD